MTLPFSLLFLVLALTLDGILASISLVIFLTAFEAKTASSAVFDPLSLLFGAEIRSNRVLTAHNGVSILILLSRFGIEMRLGFLTLLIMGFWTDLLIRLL